MKKLGGARKGREKELNVILFIYLFKSLGSNGS